MAYFYLISQDLVSAMSILDYNLDQAIYCNYYFLGGEAVGCRLGNAFIFRKNDREKKLTKCGVFFFLLLGIRTFFVL